MRIEANAIKIKNVILVALCGLIVPISRVLDHHAASIASTAAWLTPLAAALLFVPYCFILVSITKKYPDKGLAEINKIVLGNIFGTIINVLYMAWFTLLSAYYLCKFGERMAATVFYDTDATVFVSMILILLSFALRRGQEPLLRACSIFFFAVAAVFIFSLLSVTPNIHPEYNLPVEPSLTGGVLKGGVQIFSVLTYFTTVPFFFKHVKSESLSKYLFKGGSVALLLCLLSIFVIVGLFSAPLVAEMPFPFFSAVKEISVFDSVERIEAIIICVMILSDFSIITLFMLCFGNAAKETFKLKAPVKFDLILLLVFIISLFFSSNSTKLNHISAAMIVPLNLIVGAGLPFILFMAVVLCKRKKA